jgi:hypothetical protein
MNSEYYCGLPQNQWDILAEQAEEILRDQEYGQHILGLYPAGPRIYGIESSSPSLLCLYVDTVDSLIDPSKSSRRLIKESVGNSDSKIYFSELYDWAKWLFHSITTSSSEALLAMLPIVQDIFYEDESISTIISVAKEMILSSGTPYPDTGVYRDHPALQMRALTIFKLRKTFNPCINKDLGVVIGLDELGVYMPDFILDYDKRIIDAYLCQSSRSTREIEDLEEQYINYLFSICPSSSQNHDSAIKNYRLLGKEIANLYRYQL